METHTDGHDRGSITDHPEDAQPLGETHAPFTRGEKRALFILSVAFVVCLVAVPVLAVMTLSPTGNVLLALLPLLATLAIDMGIVASHYKHAVLWPVLLLTHIIGTAALWLVSPLLASPLNVPQAMTLSILLGGAVTLLAFLVDVPTQKKRTYRRPLPVAFTPEKLPEFVQSIEDKAKALNFAIGRVYRASNGGTSGLRARLRIPREWYNEYTTADEQERTGKAKVLVRKIHDRLLLYKKTEAELFSPEELKKLKNAARKKDGGSTVISVLKENDSDPVEHYYTAAVETCEKILEGLSRA